MGMYFDLYGTMTWHTGVSPALHCTDVEKIKFEICLKHDSFMQLEFSMLCKCKSSAEMLVILKKNAQFKSSMAVCNSKTRLAVIRVSLAAFSKSNVVPFKCHHPILFLTKLGYLDMLVLYI